MTHIEVHLSVDADVVLARVFSTAPRVGSLPRQAAHLLASAPHGVFRVIGEDGAVLTATGEQVVFLPADEAFIFDANASESTLRGPCSRSRTATRPY